METAYLVVGYLTLAVLVVNAGNDRLPGKQEMFNVGETLGVRVQGGQEKLDEMLLGYDLVQTLSNHPKLIYSPVAKQALNRALGEAETPDTGRASAIPSLTCASHVSKIIDDLRVPELYALNSEYSTFLKH